jgi:hypothetical protein
MDRRNELRKALRPLAEALLEPLAKSYVKPYTRRVENRIVRVRAYTRRDSPHSQIAVQSVYHAKFPAEAKRLGGRWVPEEKLWVFPADQEERVRALCRRVYGSDDKVQETTEVRVKTPYYDKNFVSEAKRSGGQWDPENEEWVFPRASEGAVAEMCSRIFGAPGEEEGGGAAEVPPGVPTEKMQVGEGYGGELLPVGTTLRFRRDPDRIVTVVRSWSRYFSHDGMSFGVGAERGHVYYADVRDATPEEKDAFRRREREARRARRHQTHWKRVVTDWFKKHGERPKAESMPEGERISDTFDVYGGGDTFVVGPDHIWYIQNHGAEGDDWSLNNVRTGGAGAIGWRVPYSRALDRLVRRLAGEELSKSLTQRKRKAKRRAPGEIATGVKIRARRVVAVRVGPDGQSRRSRS